MASEGFQLKISAATIKANETSEKYSIDGERPLCQSLTRACQREFIKTKKDAAGDTGRRRSKGQDIEKEKHNQEEKKGRGDSQKEEVFRDGARRGAGGRKSAKSSGGVICLLHTRIEQRPHLAFNDDGEACLTSCTRSWS